MTESEIFGYLFEIAKSSKDPRGVVAACLVRNDEIIAGAASSDDGVVHAEDNLIRKLRDLGFKIDVKDIAYATMEPCGFRNPEGLGKHLPGCLELLVQASVTTVIYGVANPPYRKESAECKLVQTNNKELINKCREIFNSSLAPGLEHKRI